MAISLDKKLETLAQTAPEPVVSLAKAAAAQLTQAGDALLPARVILVLDDSGSMAPLYRNGSVKDLITKALAVGLLLDDNGEIDVITFAGAAKYQGTVSLKTLDADIRRLTDKSLGGGTSYAAAMQEVKYLLKKQPSNQPVLVQFLTDGEPSDPERTESLLRVASASPIFWQFVGLGGIDYLPEPATPAKKAGFFGKMINMLNAPAGDGGFAFLRKLDTLAHRTVDNAGFFAVRDPKTLSNDAYYQRLLSEYPTWLQEAYPKVKDHPWD